MPQPPVSASFRGRQLPHPDEPVYDQGLRFDLETLLERRRVLRVMGGVAGALGLAACGADQPSGTSSTSAASSSGASSGRLEEIPDETAGPYPGNGSNGPDVLEQSGVVRQDIRSSFGEASGTAEGVPLTITMELVDVAAGGGALTGAAVYAWHCNREGEYSMYSASVTDENYLRGVQVSDSSGKVSFTSVFPGCYSGRWPHIHFQVFPDQASITDADTAIATSQIALPKDVCDTVYAEDGYSASVGNLAQVTLAGDNVFGEDEGALQLATMSGAVAQGYTATLRVGVDTSTEPSGGSVPGGGGPGSDGSPPGLPPSRS